ncbi:hypothetical protein COY71_04915 [Candidatus Micrarchaeota archaeon CG_4_10_14_0_8_um_filter_60_7]|nr:MAG: hypothetical protein COY71_04915 [Candidatus Micrarchaeota archaeon CG_4_10_14_0_8_um_filter_60_7]
MEADARGRARRDRAGIVRRLRRARAGGLLPKAIKPASSETILVNLRYASIVDYDSDAYPGKTSTVIYLAGCPLNCPYCPTPELIKADAFDEKAAAYFLYHLDSVKHATDAVVIRGGEPLVQGNALIEFCRGVKKKGFSIKLETAGFYPESLNDLLPFLDFVSMAIKAPLRKEVYAASCNFRGDPELLLSNALRSLTFLEKRGQGVFKEFVIPVSAGLNDSPEAIGEIAEYVASFADRLVLERVGEVPEEKMQELLIYAQRSVKDSIEG